MEIIKESDILKTRPAAITFDITDRCQMRCITCSKWNTPVGMAENELSTQEWKEVIFNLKNWLGSFSFIFSGGEPFLRQDIFELIEYAASLDHRVTVISNGLVLDKIIDKIAEAPISSLIISLNGVTPDSHDKTRGIPGSFDKAVGAIFELDKMRKASSKDMRLNISTILMPQNYNQIIPLTDWVKENGIDGISYQLLEDNVSFHSYSSHESLDTQNYETKSGLSKEFKDVTTEGISVIDMLIEKKQMGYQVRNSYEQLEAMKILLNNPSDILRIKCRVGYNNFSVDPYGNVRLCYNMEPVGSIKKDTPEDIWNSQNSLSQREHINSCKMYCRLLNCNFKKN